MAAALAQIGYVYQDQGEYDKAIEKHDASAEHRARDRRRRRPGHQPAPALHPLHAQGGLRGRAGPQPGGGEAGPQAGPTRLEWPLTSTSRASSTTAWPAPRRPTTRPTRHRAAAFDRFTGRAWRSTGASGTRPARPTRLGELGKLLQDAGQMREAIAMRSVKRLKSTSELNNPVKVGSNSRIAGHRPRTPGPVRGRAGEVSAGVGVVAQVRFAAAVWPSWSGTLRGCGGRWATDRTTDENG